MTPKQQKAHKDAVAQIGCIRCLELGHEDSPCEIHHCGTGAGGRRDETKVVGLCPWHHRWLKDSIDKAGKERSTIESRLLEYIAEHCGCDYCKDARQ